MKYKNFAGIDVSKDSIDVCLLHNLSQKEAPHAVFDNSVKGFEKMARWLKTQGAAPATCLFCMEHTGVYSLELSYWLQQAGFALVLENPLHLRRTMGIVRGKNDKADARMIARYACMNREALKLVDLPSKLLLTLKNLLTHRNGLIRQRTQIKINIKRIEQMGKNIDVSLMEKQNSQQIELINQQLEEVTNQLQELAGSDEFISQNLELVRSIPGIGLVIALTLIAQTNNFTGFENGRQFACYAGSAPFEYSSGSSVRGKTKVHPIANKQIKALLTTGALAAVKYDREVKRYFERKTAEGKAKMLVLNNIRAKLINRAFAVVKRGTPYVQKNF